jgi:Transposase DDE domain
VDPRTVRRMAREAKSPGVATGFPAGKVDDDAQNAPPRPPAPKSLATPSACAIHREWIEAQVLLGRNAMSIYQDLVEQHGFSHAYNSVKRFVGVLKARGKHFALTIEESGFEFKRLELQIAAKAALDGLYVIRISVPKKHMSSAEAVRSYKALAQVERAFRSMKTIDLHVLPIHHRLEQRVRAHIFLCMLAYYVEWHMREAWRELMFADEDLEHKKHRDPVAAAQRSEAALDKVATRNSKTVHPYTAFARCSTNSPPSCAIPAKHESLSAAVPRSR